LAAQDSDPELKRIFAKVAEQLIEKESVILQEIAAAEGKPTDIGGYYKPDFEKASKAMRPSASLNAIIEAVS